MSNIRKMLLKYGIATVSALGVTVLVLYLHGIADAVTVAERYRILADAFTVPGVILVMVAALVWVSTFGFFDGLSYAARQLTGLFLPVFGKKHKHLTYYDHKVERENKRVVGYGFLFFVGLVFVAVAVLFTILHGQVYVPMN